MVYFWSIISGFIYFIAKSAVNTLDKFKRTDKGNILTEKLYGMRNFIRDFSNLDEATKKHIVLWREFLIYAVTLEENDIILSIQNEEIETMCGLREVLYSKNVGEVVNMTLIRNSIPLSINVKLEEE
jgi:uncharacterized membrane protein